jgi:endosialidase-like protein
MSQDLIAPGRVRVGTNLQNSEDVQSRFVAADATRGMHRYELYSANALGGTISLGKARGTPAAPGNVTQNDPLGYFLFRGYSGTWFDTASVEVYVDAAVVGGQRPSSRLEFKTNLANTAPRLVGYLSQEGYLGVGTAFNASVAATRAAHPVHAIASGTGADLYVTAEYYGATGPTAVFRTGRARGTFAAPTIVGAGDLVGEFEFWAYTNQWHHCAEIRSEVCGTPAAGVIPDSDLHFRTTSGGAVDALRMRIMPAGQVIVGPGGSLTEAQIAANSVGTLWIAYGDGTAPLGLQRASADTGASTLYFRKSRGTLAAPATTVNGDELAYIQAGAYTNAWHDNLGVVALYIDAAVVAGQRPASRIEFKTQPNNAGGPSTRMVIYSGGCVFIGGGTADTTRIFHIANATTSFAIARIQSTGGGATNNVLRLDGGDNSTTGSKFIIFHRPDGTEIGSVSQNAAGTVAYNTSSDARLKTDIQDSDMGLAEVLRIRPRRFRFRTDRTNQILHGFVAQELVTVFPEAVTIGATAKDCDCDLGRRGEHDPDCCNSSAWGVDYGKLTPILVKAIQELTARVAALEGR